MSKPFFLQLQGIKFVHSFIDFKFQEITNIPEILDVLKEFFPTFINNNFEDSEEFLHETKIQFQLYIKALCKPNVDLTSYPYKDGSISSQVVWLEKNCAKSVNMFRVRNLIHSLYNNTFYHKLYEKDATSSGLQIISILMQDVNLALKTNVTGNTPRDIYKEIIIHIEELFTGIKEELNSFCKAIFDMSYDDFIGSKLEFLCTIRALLHEPDKNKFDKSYKK